MTLILCGFKSCGKTTIGRQLALKLGVDFIDTDELLIQRYFIEIGRYVSIAELYEALGEAEFRRLESNTIQQLIPDNKTIIATGGGSFLDESNGGYLRRLGLIVYLSLDPLILKKRIEESEIPTFMRSNFENTFFILLNQRIRLYQQIADVTLDITHLSIEEIVVKLTQLRENYGS
jgi:shikimate kinase